MGMDPDVINFDDLPDAPTQPKMAAPQGAPDVIGFDDLPDAPQAAVQQDVPTSGIMRGVGNALARSYYNYGAESGMADRFNLRAYKTSLEQGGDLESDIGELIMSGKATPEQNDLFMRRVPRTDPAWRAAEIARVNNEMAKLDQSIAESEQGRQEYPAQSRDYQRLQAGIDKAKQNDTMLGKIGGVFGAAIDNPMGVPELFSEGGVSTARPVLGAFGAAIAARRGQLGPLAQKAAPIMASMGITGFDSYKSQISNIIEEKAKQGGFDLRKDPKAMDTLLDDVDFVNAVKSEALRAGVNDAGWAAFSTYLGISPRIKGVWQPVVQSAAEMGNEASRQLVTKGEVVDPTAIGVAGVTAGPFEGISYGVGRAIGVFGKPAAPGAPGAQAAPQAEPTTTPPPAAAPDVINVDDLPDAPRSVAGETEATPPSTPAPAQAGATPEWLKPAEPAAAQPEPVAEPVAPVAEAPAPVEQPAAPAAPAPVAVEPEATPAPAPQPVATAQPAAPAQTEIPGTADTFNLTGEQVAAPTTRAEDTTSEMPLEGTQENPLATEARARLAKLEAAGKGDSGQAQALRRTIERETQPAAQAVEQKPKGMTVEIMGKKYPVASMQEASAKWLSATKQIEDSGVSLNRDTGLQENLWSGDGPVVRDADGKIIGYIAQNGSIKKDRNVVAEGNDLYVPTDADYDAAGYPRQEQAAKPSGKEPAEVKAARKVIENPKSIDELNNAWDTVFKYEKKGKYAVEAKPEQPQIAQPNVRTDAEIKPPQSPQAEPVDAGEKNPLTRTPQPPDVVPPEGYPQPETKPTAEQPKQAKADPSISEAAKAKKSDQPQTKRARTALRNAIRKFGRDDKRTERKYRAVLDALEREAFRDKSARDVSQPYLGRKEPADIKAAREILAKKAKATGGISGYDVAKANALIDQYEAEVDLSQGQLRDDGQIRLVSDETLNRVIAHVQGMLDAGKRPDADAQNAFDLATAELTRRENESTEGYGDPIADVRGIARRGVGIPLLPTVRTERGETAFAGTEYAALAESLPPELSKEGGLFVEPAGGVDVERARKDATYRNELRIAAEGMMEKLSARLIELGWTQLEGDSMGVIQLLQDAAMGRAQIPEGGVNGASFKGDPNTVAKTHGGDINLDALGSEGQVNTEEEADTREPEPSEEDKQAALDMEVEYEDPRFDATPTAADQAVLDAAAEKAPTEESILEALDKAAKEALNPNNLNEGLSSMPRLAAALTWVTAREIQKGLTNFAKWSADKAKQFPSLKGSLKAIWAKAQKIAKNPIDYLTFRALDNVASKAWQNVARNKQSETLRKLANIVFAKGGPDADAVENDIPDRIDLTRKQFQNTYAAIMDRFAAEFAGQTKEQRQKWDVDFRDYVLGRKQPTDMKTAQAVKDYRNLMRDLLAYQREAGITMGDVGEKYFPRHYDIDAVEADRDGFVKVAMEMYQKRDARLLAKAIDDVRKQQEARPDERKAADKKFGRKEKTDAEYAAEAAEWAQEKIDALQAEHDAKDEAHYKELAEDWATAITHGDVLGLTLFKNTEGKVKSDSTDARTFNDAEADLADKFLKKNIDEITAGYVDGAVRGAELARVFGEDGKKFEQMMNKLSEEGVDKDTILETRDLVAHALGIGRNQLSQSESVFFDWVNVVLASAYLGKTFIYNLTIEPASFGVRTGSAYLALRGVAETWKNAIAEIGTPSATQKQLYVQQFGDKMKFEDSVNKAVAEQLGLVQKEIERAYLNTHWDYSAGEKGSKLAKWISQRIYRANLMTATETAKVQASVAIARLALRDNARFLRGEAPLQKLFNKVGMDTRADKSVAVIFNENGVPAKDHKAFADWVMALEGKTDAEWQKAVMGSDPMAKYYRRALQRMSRGMSIRTNNSLKLANSDTTFGRLLMQLMNFSYAYGSLVKDRMYSMAAATAAKDASKIDRLRYAAPLMVGAPLAILGAFAAKELTKTIWPSDDAEEAISKQSDNMKAFNLLSFAGMFGPKVEFLTKGFLRGQAPGGATGDMIFKGGAAAFSAASDPENATKEYNFKKQAYSTAVKPAVTGGASAIHPFFGFIGNATVNNQDFRESVIGDKPKK